MERLERVDDLYEAGFHIVDARPADDALANFKGHFLERAKRPDRVTMAKQQLQWALLLARPRPRIQVSAALVTWEESNGIRQAAQELGQRCEDRLLHGWNR